MELWLKYNKIILKQELDNFEEESKGFKEDTNPPIQEKNFIYGFKKGNKYILAQKNGITHGESDGGNSINNECIETGSILPRISVRGDKIWYWDRKPIPVELNSEKISDSKIETNERSTFKAAILNDSPIHISNENQIINRQEIG